MSLRNRLIMLALSLAVLLGVTWALDVDVSHLLSEFWFTAGLLLLVLISLVDQPFFSKDASVFANGTTAWVSLLMVETTDRDWWWWLFFAWASYLVIASYALMWARARELKHEPPIVQFLSRLNRQIGRPQAVFSAFFVWGCAKQFSVGTNEFNAFFMYWAVFTILSLPDVASLIDRLLDWRRDPTPAAQGSLVGIISPRVAEAELAHDAPSVACGDIALIRTSGGAESAKGIVLDERVVAGRRLAWIGITEQGKSWSDLAKTDAAPTIEVLPRRENMRATPSIGIVDVGSSIGALQLSVHPDLALAEGELLRTRLASGDTGYYQIVSARVDRTELNDSNAMHTIDVVAGQLGKWDAQSCRFEPLPWVAAPGMLIERVANVTLDPCTCPTGHCQVGRVPNSQFPVHVDVADLVTHNAAIIGVTGSGKSYLTFHLIESIARLGIKVMVLDVSRQHWVHLAAQNPTSLRRSNEVATWLDSQSMISVHQFAESQNFPQTTTEFVKAAFDRLSQVQLRAGRNEPARLCIILEEAHSLIPEWNQVAQKGDEQHVNQAARVILQGRKFGMGCIIVSQRTANVTKTMLNQCNTIFSLQTFDQTGLDFLKNYMGDEYALAISTLPRRHAILVGKASSSARPIIFEIVDLGDHWKEPKPIEIDNQAAQDLLGAELADAQGAHAVK